MELQEQAGKESYTPGVTPDELKKIALDLGIDVNYLQQAIDEANSTETRRGPFSLTEEFERVVDYELPPEDFDVILHHLKPFGRRHPIAQVGRTLTGRTWTGTSFANVEVTSKRGRTRVKVKSNPLFAFLVTLYPAFVASTMLLGPLGESGHLLVALGLIAVVLVLAGLCFTGLVRSGHKSAKKLTDRLAQAVAENAEETQVAPPAATSVAPEEPIVQRLQG